MASVVVVVVLEESMVLTWEQVFACWLAVVVEAL